MGAHPFDYCGPTYTCGPGGCSLCEPRAGSILSGPPPVGARSARRPWRTPVGNINLGEDVLSPSANHLDGPPGDAAVAPNEGTVVEGPVSVEEGPVTEGPEIVATPAPTASTATPPKAAESTGWTAARHHDAPPPENTNP